MPKFIVNKLVRDKIIDQIYEFKGNSATVRELSKEEYIEALKAKLHEEAKEVAETSNDEMVSELADIEEILQALLVELHIPQSEFTDLKDRKLQANGGYKKRIFLEKVSLSEVSPWIEKYRQQFTEE